MTVFQKCLFAVVLMLSMGGCGDSARSFEKKVFRAIDDKTVVKLLSKEEAEVSIEGTNYVCKYSEEGGSLRMVLNIMGGTEAIYYRFVPEGLSDSHGVILYEPGKYDVVMSQVAALRRQTALNSALIEAAREGNAGSIAGWIKEGAEIEAVDLTRNTPLMCAVAGGHVEALRALLEHNANPNTRYSDGRTPLMVAARYRLFSGRDRKFDTIVEMLIGAGADLNSQDRDGDTALMSSLRGSNYEAAQILVNAGANREIRNQRGHNAFDLARNGSESLKAALRTEPEAQRFQRSREPTLVLAEFAEMKPRFGLRGDEVWENPTVITDVSLYRKPGRSDAGMDVWFGDIEGEVIASEGIGETILGSGRKEYYVECKTGRSSPLKMIFLKVSDRDRILAKLQEAVSKWRRTFKADGEGNAGSPGLRGTVGEGRSIADQDARSTRAPNVKVTEESIRPQPPYPPSARERGVTGQITVSLQVNSAGSVDRAVATASKGGFTDEEQMEVAKYVERNWSFPPGTQRKYSVNLVFKLNSR